MSFEQAFRLATRTLAVFFLFWVVADIFNFALDAVSLSHYITLLRTGRSVMGGRNGLPRTGDQYYFLRDYALRCAVQAVQVALWSGAAIALYRGGPAVRYFFVAPSTGSADTTGQPLP